MLSIISLFKSPCRIRKWCGRCSTCILDELWWVWKWKVGPCPFWKGPCSSTKEAQACVLLYSRFFHLVSDHPERHKITQAVHYSLSKSEYEHQCYPSEEQSSNMNQKPVKTPWSSHSTSGNLSQGNNMKYRKKTTHTQFFAMSFIIAKDYKENT